MPSTSGSSKPSTLARRTKPDVDSDILTALTNPSKCDDQLARRLAKALNITEQPVTAKATTKGKQKLVQSGDDVEDKRRLAMRAANIASQSLGKVVQSGWKAPNHKATPAFSMSAVLSIVSSFRMTVQFLRDVKLNPIEVERVASGFVGKLIAVQLYGPALELLDEIKVNVIRSYKEFAPSPPKTPGVRGTTEPSFTKYMHLVEYPQPAPKDPILLGLIGTSLSQAVTAVTAMMQPSPPSPVVLEKFAALMEGNGGPISWHSSLAAEYADALLARVHRALATTFTPSNAAPNVLLGLRAVALRCLLHRITLDRDSFWTQATNYMASHGKSVIKSEEAMKAVNDIVTFFSGIVTVARVRHDAITFMTGSSFMKFCEVALVFAKRGNAANLNAITQFINAEDSSSDVSNSTGDDLTDVKLHAMLSSAVAVLENQAGGCPGPESFNSLSRCTAALSKAAPSSTTRSDVLRSLERLRRACGKVFDNVSGGDELVNGVKSLLVVILGTMENCMQHKEGEDFTASIVDSLCILAKVELLPPNVATHMTSYDYLQRAVTLAENHCHDPEGSTGKGTADSTLSRSRIMRVVAGAFWNSAVVLYQDGKYAAAIRFLVQACGLTVRTCDMVKGLEDLGSSDLRTEPLKVLKSHLPKRWELLGDCYSRIGERRLAHGAFLESLTTHSFDILCRSAAHSSPNQLSSETIHRRLVSLVDRITSIAVFDLLMQGEASLRKTLCAAGVCREAVGIVLEWQATSLDESSRKDDVRPALDRILRDAVDLYVVDFPIRRVRVLLRQLDLAYRSDDLSTPVFEMAADIQDLLLQDAEKDGAFIHMQPQYKAVAHMWTVFHAHRHSQNNSHSAVILHHAAQASRILRCMFPPTQVSGFVKSPKNSPRASTTKTVKPTTRTSPRKRKTTATNINPVTPKPRKVAIQTPPNAKSQMPSPSKTPPKPPGSPVYPHLITSIQMMAQLMGLLGHIVLKIQFLNILQRMTERSAGPSADDFVRATVDAANEYLRLGKTQRSMAIYGHALAAVSTATTISDEVRVTLLLHYAASHALNGNVEKSSSLYEEARHWARNIECRQANSTAARIRARVLTLEHSALASSVFSAIQIAQDDPHAAFSTLRKSLRLWNRALDTLARLSPPTTSTSNPFDLSSLANALPVTSGKSQQEILQSKKSYRRNTAIDGLQWRIAEGLLHTLFGLGRAYFLQGTVRGAEYYIEQARDLAASLNSPTMLGRALAKKGELQLHQGRLEDAATTLMEASDLLHDIPGIDAADISRLRAHHSQLTDQHKEAKALYSDIVNMLSTLAKSLIPMENGAPNSRRSSLVQSPGRHNSTDVLVPGFLANVLRQQIWLQRNEPQTMTKPLLEQISTLPPSRETKAEELAILAKLALHDANVQFRADLFLSSLAESTIALPMGTSGHSSKLSPGARQMLETLSTAEKMFWASLEFVANRGQSSEVREAAMSLALIQSFQTTLGKSWTNGARVAAGLLDASAAITLRRELIDEIEQKYPELVADDLAWPTIHGQPPIVSHSLKFAQSVGSNDDTDQEDPTDNLKVYWRAVRDRYYSSYDLNDQSVSTSQTDNLPENWTVVNISITEDKTTMFFSRQRCGIEPLIFCVPLERHGRKEEDAKDQFMYGDAVGQLRDILRESDMSAEAAKDVPSQDRDAKVAWWAKRAALDKRMRGLLDNIEFCWLGAFKTILSEPVKMQSDILNSLRVRFEKLFKRNLGSDKKRMPRVHLDDALMECFASLSPKCRDEELEDLVYFILDLYQFHGVHIALSEIDMDQLTVELRVALEEHASKAKNRIVPVDDPHLFLVLDKNVQGIPWESIPILRGRSVSRIPSLSFLVDRIELAKLQRESLGASVSNIDRAVVNPKKTFYVLNPGGDLTKSEARFGAWAKEMEAPAVGWQGIVGRKPSEQELLNAFSKKDLFIYFGHGGAEQYVRSHKIKQLQRCAATMLWGCSSGLMREMGDFDRVGTPYNYMLAGCPTLVACLWDVTDNELDKISRSVFDKLRLDADHVKAWSPEFMDDAPTSLIAAVGQSRDACKLKYLTGAAPVVYGIPFYL